MTNFWLQAGECCFIPSSNIAMLDFSKTEPIVFIHLSKPITVRGPENTEIEMKSMRVATHDIKVIEEIAVVNVLASLLGV